MDIKESRTYSRHNVCFRFCTTAANRMLTYITCAAEACRTLEEAWSTVTYSLGSIPPHQEDSEDLCHKRSTSNTFLKHHPCFVLPSFVLPSKESWLRGVHHRFVCWKTVLQEAMFHFHDCFRECKYETNKLGK